MGTTTQVEAPKKRRWPWIVVGSVGALALYGAVNAPEEPPPARPTSTTIDDDMRFDGDQADALLALVWADTDQESQASVCTGFDVFGDRWAYDQFLEGAGGDIVPFAEFSEFFSRVC